MTNPVSWQRKTLGEIARISSGGTPDRGEPRYWGGNIPWVTTGEIQFNTITDTSEKITDSGLKNSSAKLFPPGTLLMAMYGQGKTRGQVAKLAIEAATNQNSAAIHLHAGHDADFYFQYLWWKYDEIRAFGNSGGISHLNAGLLKEITVPVPPIIEQRQIAALLALWDCAISKSESLIANSQRQRHALMRRLFTVSLDWPTRRLDEIAERVSSRVDAGDYPVLMISSSTGFVHQDQKYSRFMAGKSLDNYILLRRGEFAYNKGNSKRYEFGCIYPLESENAGLVPHVYVCFRLKPQGDISFYKYVFEADYLRNQLAAIVNTGVRNNGLLNIRPGDFMAVSVPAPPLTEQRRLGEVLDIASLQITQQTRELALLRREKQVLMHQLITGRRSMRIVDSCKGQTA